MTTSFLYKYRVNILIILAHVLTVVYYSINPTYVLIGIVVAWFMHNFAHSLYIHRVRCHGQFEWNQTLHTIGLAMFSMMNMGSPAVYVAVHANHHKYAGTDQDPHDPYVIGFGRALASIWTETFMPHRKVFARQLREPKVKWFHKHYFKFAIATALLFPMFTVVAFYLSKLVLIIVHVKSLGYGESKIPGDTSKNIPWLKPICWGEELHCNHHIQPRQGNHNIKGNLAEFDFIYYVGRFFEFK